MPRLLQNRRVFVIAILCGAIISACYYVMPPLGAQRSPDISPLMWPIALLSLLNIVPRIFVARILWEALWFPPLLGEAVGFLYWPFLGAFLGVCKHWIIWAVVILGINIGLLALFLYSLRNMKWMFF